MRLRLAGVLAAVLLAAACGGTSAGGTKSGAAPAANDPAPLTFTATTLTGERFDAAAELDGEPAVLWFWAPWCTVCRAEAPEVADVAAEFAGRVPVIGVPGRGEIAAMRRFVEDTGTGKLAHVVDGDGSIWSRFGVVTQPAFTFIDADGEIETFQGALPADDLRERLAALTENEG